MTTRLELVAVEHQRSVMGGSPIDAISINADEWGSIDVYVACHPEERYETLCRKLTREEYELGEGTARQQVEDVIYTLLLEISEQQHTLTNNIGEQHEQRSNIHCPGRSSLFHHRFRECATQCQSIADPSPSYPRSVRRTSRH